MAIAWRQHGNGMAMAWQRHGNGMATAWQHHGNSMASMATSWQQHGISMATAWQQHGNIMASAWQRVTGVAAAGTRIAMTFWGPSAQVFGVAHSRGDEVGRPAPDPRRPASCEPSVLEARGPSLAST